MHSGIEIKLEAGQVWGNILAVNGDDIECKCTSRYKTKVNRFRKWITECGMKLRRKDGQWSTSTL